MKFLCIACDEAMRLEEVSPPDGGSLSVVYGCVHCGHRIAMLTNPYETQLVNSLGVKIGPGAGAAAAGAAATAEGGTAAERAAAGGCPFSGMVAEMETKSDAVTWTDEALARLERVPEMVRPMARQGIEHYAKSQGRQVVDAELMAEARGTFGM